MNEIAIFKKAVRDPVYCKTLAGELEKEMGLSGNASMPAKKAVSTTLDNKDQDAHEATGNKLALKLFYKVWSGFTKYIRSQCKQGRVFSCPFIGKFCPKKGSNDEFAFSPSLDFVESANFKYEENEYNLSPFTSFQVS